MYVRAAKLDCPSTDARAGALCLLPQGIELFSAASRGLHLRKGFPVNDLTSTLEGRCSSRFHPRTTRFCVEGYPMSHACDDPYWRAASHPKSSSDARPKLRADPGVVTSIWTELLGKAPYATQIDCRPSLEDHGNARKGGSDHHQQIVHPSPRSPVGRD